jgi:hypothetical protein
VLAGRDAATGAPKCVTVLAGKLAERLGVALSAREKALTHEGLCGDPL